MIANAWLIYFIALLYGVGGTVFYPARAAVLRLMLPEDLLADANGVLSSTQQGLRIIAPLVGASLYAAVGGGAVAALDAATFAGQHSSSRGCASSRRSLRRRSITSFVRSRRAWSTSGARCRSARS